MKVTWLLWPVLGCVLLASSAVGVANKRLKQITLTSEMVYSMSNPAGNNANKAYRAFDGDESTCVAVQRGGAYNTLWLQVDMGEEVQVDRIEVLSKANYANKLLGFYVIDRDAETQLGKFAAGKQSFFGDKCRANQVPWKKNKWNAVTCRKAGQRNRGRYFSIILNPRNTQRSKMNICEIKLYLKYQKVDLDFEPGAAASPDVAPDVAPDVGPK